MFVSSKRIKAEVVMFQTEAPSSLEIIPRPLGYLEKTEPLISFPIIFVDDGVSGRHPLVLLFIMLYN